MVKKRGDIGGEEGWCAQVELASALRMCLSNPDSLSWSFLKDGKPCRATEESSGSRPPLERGTRRWSTYSSASVDLGSSLRKIR